VRPVLAIAALAALTASAGCGSDHGGRQDRPAAADEESEAHEGSSEPLYQPLLRHLTCPSGARVATVTDRARDVTDQALHPRHGARTALIDLRRAAIATRGNVLCATWRTAEPPLAGSIMSVIMAEKAGPPVELAVHLADGRARVTGTGFGEDGDENEDVRADVAWHGRLIRLRIDRRHLPRITPPFTRFLWAAAALDGALIDQVPTNGETRLAFPG